MKRFLINMFMAVFAVSTYGTLLAQDYYTGKTTVTGNNVTYQLYGDSDPYIIYNANNTKSLLKGKFTDGTEIQLFQTEAKAVDREQLYRAIRETFSPSELATLKVNNPNLNIIFTHDGAGNVFEVFYLPYLTSAFTWIPPDKLFTLEQKIKQYVKYNITAALKPIEYKHTGFSIHFDRISGDGLAPEPPGGDTGGGTGGNQGGGTGGTGGGTPSGLPVSFQFAVYNNLGRSNTFYYNIAGVFLDLYGGTEYGFWEPQSGWTNDGAPTLSPWESTDYPPYQWPGTPVNGEVAGVRIYLDQLAYDGAGASAFFAFDISVTGSDGDWSAFEGNLATPAFDGTRYYLDFTFGPHPPQQYYSIWLAAYAN